MQKNNLYLLIKPDSTTLGVKKDRKNDTCDLQAWYYQTDNNTLAYGILVGAHGERKDIPAVRKYFISSGEAIFVIDGKEYQAAVGTPIEIPVHSTYDFFSVGDESLKFFVDVGVKLDLDKIPSN